MSKRAKIATFIFHVRFIVDEDKEDDGIKACVSMRELIRSDGIMGDIVDIKNDEDEPYGTYDHDEIS